MAEDLQMGGKFHECGDNSERKSYKHTPNRIEVGEGGMNQKPLSIGAAADQHTICRSELHKGTILNSLK
jgi:hypothetical protein